MNLPPSVRVQGIEWKLFTVNFSTPDGKFSAYLYAVSPEHLSYQLEALKETAVINEIPSEI